jgi:hypothetical protein
MLVRLHVVLPFDVALPEGEQIRLYTYEEDGCVITVYPPMRSDAPSNSAPPESVKINGVTAIIANGLQIDFQRSEFDRTPGSPEDPPSAVLQRAVDSFIERLRYVARAAHVHAVSLQTTTWRLRYLDDEGSELPTSSKVVGRGGNAFRWSLVGVNKTLWDQLHELPGDFTPPPWDGLRLDAQAALPHVGTAVVLAATALEVFIEVMLEQLAARSDVPKNLWQWVVSRKNPLCNPDVEEQFDTLLGHFVGHSLKENPDLWGSFMNLKRARNTFVHEGVATIGEQPVTVQQAGLLVGCNG